MESPYNISSGDFPMLALYHLRRVMGKIIGGLLEYFRSLKGSNPNPIYPAELAGLAVDRRLLLVPPFNIDNCKDISLLI